MKEDFSQEKKAIFEKKLRCNMCHEIPIIKEIFLDKSNCFITSECLNHHGVFLCPIQDYVSDKSQLDKVKCFSCQNLQTIVDSPSKLFNFCRECNKFFCPKCFNSHITKFQKTHHILKINELDYMCKEHNGPFIGFCEKCNINICPLCSSREHFEHKKKLYFDQIKLSNKEYNEVKVKVDKQKKEIDEVSSTLDLFVKFVNDKVKIYKNNLNFGLKLNSKILNSYVQDKLNYQSILNFNKVIDIDISDIDFVKEIQDEIYKIVELIKSKSSNINVSRSETQTSIMDKELIQTVKDTLISSSEEPIIEYFEEKSKENNPFLDNELLEKIAKKNKKILNKEDILGVVKKIYTVNELDVYMLIIDNGIFIYDQGSNEIINYIDINEGFEYNEINMSAYYYNKKDNLINLFLGTTSNRIKIFTINESEDFKNVLIQELLFEKIVNIFTNQNEELLVLEKQGISIYSKINGKYEKKNQINIEENNKLKNLYETENYLIATLEGKNEIIFYDKNKLKKICSIGDISNDENTKMFELSKNLICVSFKSKIQVVDIEAKTVSLCYENMNVNYIQCAQVINNKKIFISFDLSKNNNNKTIFYTFEWNDKNKKLIETDVLEDLNCKMICETTKNKIIMYSKYGINSLELKN